MSLLEIMTKSRLGLLFWVVLTLVGGAALVRNVLSWRDWFQAVMQKTIVAQGVDVRMLGFKPALFWIFAVLIVCTAAFAVLFIRAEMNLSSAQNAASTALLQADERLQAALAAKDERSTTAYKTMERMMIAATRIRDQTHPGATRVRKVVRKVHATFLIHNNFDGEVSQVWEIGAKTETVNFWTVDVRACDEAEGAEYLDDVKFKVRDKTGNGKDVVYLPTVNEKRFKKVVIYFLPEIVAEEDPARRIEISYFWPGLLRRLDVMKMEPFNWSTESLESIENMKIDVFLQKGTGRRLVCRNVGPTPGDPVPARYQEDDDWEGYSYEAKNLPAGKCQISLLWELTTI